MKHIRPATATLVALALAFGATAQEHPTEQPFGQNLPEGFELLYSTDFEDEAVLEDWELSDPDSWRIIEVDGRTVLEQFKGLESDYTPRVRSPKNIALLTKMKVGDFVLEVDVESTDIEKGAHRDICFFLGAKDPSNFYYIHVATAADPNAHNIFRVNDAPRTNIAQFTTEGVEWGVGEWHRIRIERTLEDGMIRLFFNDMEEPIMYTEDHHFDFGHVGLGSFDDTCRFDRFRLYAAGPAPEREGFFR